MIEKVLSQVQEMTFYSMDYLINFIDQEVHNRKDSILLAILLDNYYPDLVSSG